MKAHGNGDYYNDNGGRSSDPADCPWQRVQETEESLQVSRKGSMIRGVGGGGIDWQLRRWLRENFDISDVSDIFRRFWTLSVVFGLFFGGY